MAIDITERNKNKRIPRETSDNSVNDKVHENFCVIRLRMSFLTPRVKTEEIRMIDSSAGYCCYLQSLQFDTNE
jgi:hypothetical protein